MKLVAGATATYASDKYLYNKLIAVVLPVIVVKGSLSSLLYFYSIVFIRSRSPAEVAEIWMEYDIIFLASSLLLFIVYLSVLYFLYKSQDLKRVYKGTILALFGILLVGLVLGWVLGGMIVILYFKESFDILYQILYGLVSSIYDILLYLFGGFTVIALSYFIHSEHEMRD